MITTLLARTRSTRVPDHVAFHASHPQIKNQKWIPIPLSSSTEEKLRVRSRPLFNQNSKMS